MKKILLFFLLLIITTQLSALTFPITNSDNNVVGQVMVITATEVQTLSHIGLQYDVGRDAMQAANPEFDPDKFLPVGLPVIIPTRFIIPNYAHQGFIVNLAEMKLYYFPAGENTVMIFPIGIGKAGYMTPLGMTSVARKMKDPYWIPPESIRQYNKEKGIILPKIIQGGPDNPLGRRAIYLSIPTYLIHATNFPASVGSRGSFGCIRMTEKDIDHLFPLVAKNTPVRIISEPYLAGWSNGVIYLEINKPLSEDKFNLQSLIQPVLLSLINLSLQHHVQIDWQKVELALKNQTGIPTAVSDIKNKSSLFMMNAQPAWPQNTTLCEYSHICQPL
jgi:L,D-transpeptidase ErfK/SrfK